MQLEKRTVQIPNARPDIDGGHSAAKNALSPDGKYVLRALNGFPTKVIRLEDGAEQVVPGDTRYATWVHVAANGWGVVVDERGIQVIEMATGKGRKIPFKDVQRAFVAQPGVLVVLEIARSDRSTFLRPPPRVSPSC